MLPDKQIATCGYINFGRDQYSHKMQSIWQFPKPENLSVSSICTGGWGFLVGILEDGNLYCWGTRYADDLACTTCMSDSQFQVSFVAFLKFLLTKINIVYIELSVLGLCSTISVRFGSGQAALVDHFRVNCTKER